MNGDVLTSLDYRALVDFHRQKRAMLTIAMHDREVRTDLGVLKTSKQGRLTSYEEKPILKYNVSMGIYVYNINVLHYIKTGVYLDFPDLVNRLLQNNEKVVGFHSDDYWLDIGRREDYELAQKEFGSSEPPFQLH
jgi:NDP-sugar pyrophosphorylase family protein